MKKFCATLLLLALFCGVTSAEDFAAWNLNDRIHPQLKEGFMNMPEMTITPETFADIRAMFAQSAESLPQDDAVDVRNETLASGLKVRVYTPKNGATEFPGLLWIHGGGHILGTPEMDDGLCLKVAKEVGCIIVAPDYRLAPEFPYPADVEDCYSALVWMTENLPVSKDRVAVAGQSAGGGLTAAVAILARDNGDPAIHFQMPLYPMLDYRTVTPSAQQITDHRVWCKDFNIAAWKMYLGDFSGDVPAYASPSMADDLSNLPPAYIMVGQLDPFRDESITYAQRLMQAGVPVELHVVPGAFHSFENILPDTAMSIRYENEYINALAEAMK